MEINTVNYRTWQNCARLTTENYELIVAQDFGPRILHFSKIGGDNVFAFEPDAGRDTPYGYWRIYGGHRLWVAPELFPKTYHPDNDCVDVTTIADGLVLTGAVEKETGFQKSMEIRIRDEGDAVVVRHQVLNLGDQPERIAPWALSVMAPGGTAVAPLRPPGADPEGFLPTHAVSFWPYSDPGDPRLQWSQDYLMVRQDPDNQAPQKIGLTGQEGWAAYVRNGMAFVKTYIYDAARTYPDRNVSLEIYTNHSFLEVESLGPLETVGPGESVSWEETWMLFEDIPELGDAAEAIRKQLSGKSS